MVRLSKKAIILFLVLGVVVLGVTGYLVWRASTPENIAPIDVDAGDVPPVDQASCKGCRGNGREWYWVNGECSDRASNDCRVENQPETGTKCGAASASGCAFNKPGTACGDGGECVMSNNPEPTSCRCGGEKTTTPPPIVNSCDGGTIKSNVKGEVGVPMVVSGTANDKDGININQIAVKVDGVNAGNATASNVTSTSVSWSYNFTPTKESHVISVSWKDSKGATSSACTKQFTLESSPENLTSADWSIDITGGGIGGSGLMCENISGSDNAAVVTYTVKVRNTGDAEGTLSKVGVVLDSKLSEENIIVENISPAGSISGATIAWNLTGSDAIYSIGQEKTFVFALRVPKSLFGALKHAVTVTPVSGDEVKKDFESAVSCEEGGEVPETAIFDNISGQIFVSLLLIVLGIVYLNGYDTTLMNSLGQGYKRVGNMYRKNFGESARIKRNRDKFEKKLK